MPEQDVTWIKQQIEALEEARKEKKPAWLSEYELQQRLLEPSPEPAGTSPEASSETGVVQDSQSHTPS